MSMDAFDTLAPTYDADFTQSPIARHLRARVHARLDRLCAAGAQVLELGCGTGEDALHLARRGVQVLATDANEAMLAVARAKLADYAHVRLERLDLREVRADGKNAIPTNNGFDGAASNEACLVPPESPRQFSLAFANFGVLNCLDDWRPLAAWLGEILPTGGHAAFAVMPPACVWETAWHGVHGEWGVATRRWRRVGAAFGVVPGISSTQHSIHYPSVGRLTREFAPWFRRVHVEPLGLLLPPSDIYGVIEKHSRLLRTLTALDDGVGRVPLLADFADHYWIEFERRA